MLNIFHFFFYLYCYKCISSTFNMLWAKRNMLVSQLNKSQPPCWKDSWNCARWYQGRCWPCLVICRTRFVEWNPPSQYGQINRSFCKTLWNQPFCFALDIRGRYQPKDSWVYISSENVTQVIRRPPTLVPDDQLMLGIWLNHWLRSMPTMDSVRDMTLAYIGRVHL